MQGSWGRRKPRANSKHCRGSQPPGCNSDKDQQKRPWDSRILPPVGIFFKVYWFTPCNKAAQNKQRWWHGFWCCWDTHYKWLRARAPLASEARLSARFRSLDSFKALPWRGSPKLSPPHQKSAPLHRLTNRVHPNPNLTASLLISRSSSFCCGTAFLTLSWDQPPRISPSLLWGPKSAALWPQVALSSWEDSDSASSLFLV